MAVWAYQCIPCRDPEHSRWVACDVADGFPPGTRMLRLRAGPRWLCARLLRERRVAVEGVVVRDAVACEAPDCEGCEAALEGRPPAFSRPPLAAPTAPVYMGAAVRFRHATVADAALLAPMNARLIRDEGHRNPMNVTELAARLRGWLAGDYEAVLFEGGSAPLGYALYRFDQERVYLRHLYVEPAARRQGIARAALRWLAYNAWRERRRVRIDVLVGNRAGIGFWHAVGFQDYALTMEFPLSPPEDA